MMQVRLMRVTDLDDASEEGVAMVLYLTKIVNAVALALDFRQVNGARITTKRPLERSPRSEKNAVRFAEDLAPITNTRSGYIINRYHDPEKGSKV